MRLQGCQTHSPWLGFSVTTYFSWGSSQRWKEKAGAALVWLHLLASGLSSEEEAQRKRPGCGCRTGAEAEVAQGQLQDVLQASWISAPITPRLLPPPHHPYLSHLPLIFPLSQWHLVITLAFTTSAEDYLCTNLYPSGFLDCE